MINTLLTIYPQTTIVIDALDLCDVSQRWRLLDMLCEVTQSNKLVKICVSSRDETDIRGRLEIVSYVHINAVDIANRLFYAEINEGLKEEIISIIAGQANGM